MSEEFVPTCQICDSPIEKMKKNGCPRGAACLIELGLVSNSLPPDEFSRHFNDDGTPIQFEPTVPTLFGKK
jgi:hypothetical protein